MAYASKDDKVLKEGWLKKSNYRGHLTKGENRRYCILTDRYFDWYIAPRDKRKGTLALTNMLCRMQDGNCIVVGYADGSKEWKLRSELPESRLEIEEWYNAINTALENVRNLDRKYSTTTTPIPQERPNTVTQQTTTVASPAPVPVAVAPAPMPVPVAPVPVAAPAYQQTTTYTSAPAPAPMPMPMPVSPQIGYTQTTTYAQPMAPAPVYTQTTYVHQPPPPVMVAPPMQTTTTYSPYGTQVTQTYVQQPVMVAPPMQTTTTYTTSYVPPPQQVTTTRVVGPYGATQTTYTNMPPPFY